MVVHEMVHDVFGAMRHSQSFSVCVKNDENEFLLKEKGDVLIADKSVSTSCYLIVMKLQ